MLVNITNDSWFGRSAGPYQHALINAMRAVENRTAIARSATTGISLFIDPFGRTYEATDLFTSAVAVATVPVGQPTTFYTQHGDLFAWGCLIDRSRRPRRPLPQAATRPRASGCRKRPGEPITTIQMLTTIQTLITT